MLFMVGFMAGSCNNGSSKKVAAGGDFQVKLITLDPGHFHAALVQKTMYPVIDSVVHVYAPAGPELQEQLNFIRQYNTRDENPTHWKEVVYTGDDFLDKMLEEKKGNVVVLAGNNRRKTEYIKKAVDAGLNVLGDKPMAIDTGDFRLLLNAFETADEKHVLLYDIMTERSEITIILQKELSHIPEVFGELQKGTEADPAVVMESVHHFYKYVSGNVLTRPDWFFDPEQEGGSVVDVGTHLVDLVQWECFPGQPIHYKTDIEVLSAKTWPTPLTLSQFAAVTKEARFPAFLKQYVTDDSVLQTHANGEINYTIKGIHARVTARWNYKAPEGGGDTHYSLLRGTKAGLLIRQGKEENYKPTLYVRPVHGTDPEAYASVLKAALEKIAAQYPGIGMEQREDGWEITIPEKYKVGHEAHFAQVMDRYLQYLKEGKLPAWEVPCMISKYYTTTKALEIASPAK